MGLLSSKAAPVNMSGPVAEFVRTAIAKDKVVIFSKTYCPYCTMAKEVSNSVDFSGSCGIPGISVINDQSHELKFREFQ